MILKINEIEIYVQNFTITRKKYIDHVSTLIEIYTNPNTNYQDLYNIIPQQKYNFILKNDKVISDFILQSISKDSNQQKIILIGEEI